MRKDRNRKKKQKKNKKKQKKKKKNWDIKIIYLALTDMNAAYIFFCLRDFVFSYLMLTH